jgi:hypothetical protein
MQLLIAWQRITIIAVPNLAVLVAIPVKVVQALGVSKFIRPSTTLQQAEECARLPQIDRQDLGRVPVNLVHADVVGSPNTCSWRKGFPHWTRSKK